MIALLFCSRDLFAQQADCLDSALSSSSHCLQAKPRRFTSRSVSTLHGSPRLIVVHSHFVFKRLSTRLLADTRCVPYDYFSLKLHLGSNHSLLNKGTQIFQKIRSHLKIPSASKVKRSKFHTEFPHIFGVTVQNSVAWATWRLGFVNPCFKI
jgi:hypothetical protein